MNYVDQPMPSRKQQSVIVESVFLPLAAAVAAMGLAAVFVRSMAMAANMPASWLPYALLGLAAFVGATATTLSGLYNLPFALRCCDFIGVNGTAALLLYTLADLQGQFQFFGRHLELGWTNLGILGVLVAWLFSSMLATVVTRVFPTKVWQQADSVLSERLAGQEGIRAVYAGGAGSDDARIKAWRGVYQAFLALIMVYLVLSIFLPQATRLRTDVHLAIWSGVSLAGVLAYLGLTEMAGTRRSVERAGLVLLTPTYACAWGLGVLLPVVIAVVLGTSLPANISPLDSLDYNLIMTNFTQWLVAVCFRRGGSAAFQGNVGPSTAQPTIVLVYGGAGGHDPTGPIYVLGILATVWLVFSGVKMLLKDAAKSGVLLENEKEKAHGLWQILWAIITWPFRLLAGWFARFSEAENHRADMAAALTNLFKRSSRARQRRIYPQEPDLFVRYIYSRLLQNAARFGLQRRPQETALEFARSLAKVWPETAVPVDELTTMYCNTKYATRIPPVDIRSRTMRLLQIIVRTFRIRRRAKGGDRGIAG